MIENYVPAFLIAIAIVTYVLELWTGIAMAGWSGEKSLVYRQKTPGPYWFVMFLQTAIFLGVPALLWFAE